MSKSPESRISNIPRIAMAGVALFSLGFKAELNQPYHKAQNPEMTIKADSQLVNYSILLSNKLVHDYLAAHIVEHAHISTALTLAEIAASEVTPAEYAAWKKVNVCEEGGDWHAGAPGFDGLGEKTKIWIANGGQRFAPEGYLATPDEQIVEAELIQKDPPDQIVCHKGGW